MDGYDDRTFHNELLWLADNVYGVKRGQENPRIFVREQTIP